MVECVPRWARAFAEFEPRGAFPKPPRSTYLMENWIAAFIRLE